MQSGDLSSNYITVRGIKMRYVHIGDIILPDDDNSIIDVLKILCYELEKLIHKVESL